MHTDNTRQKPRQTQICWQKVGVTHHCIVTFLKRFIVNKFKTLTTLTNVQTAHTIKHTLSHTNKHLTTHKTKYFCHCVNPTTCYTDYSNKSRNSHRKNWKLQVLVFSTYHMYYITDCVEIGSSLERACGFKDRQRYLTCRNVFESLLSSLLAAVTANRKRRLHTSSPDKLIKQLWSLCPLQLANCNIVSQARPSFTISVPGPVINNVIVNLHQTSVAILHKPANICGYQIH